MPEIILNTDMLIPYSNHPFALYEGKRMDDLVESIRIHGIISPIVVRLAGDGKFEILSGHNRVKAVEILEMKEVPVIIKENISDEEAMLIVTESNLIQRSFADLKHSERAVVLKNHLEATKKFGGQGKRNDLLDFIDDNSGAQVAHKSKSRDKVAEQYALSKDTVMRYVRLAKLPKELLEKVDSDKLKFIPAIELSWLSNSELNILSKLFEKDYVNISLKQAKRIREESENNGGKLKKEDIMRIIDKKPEIIKNVKVNLNNEVVGKIKEHGVFSEKTLENIISIYLDMLDRGEIDDVLEKEEDFGE